MPDEMSVSRIVFDRDENHLPCSDTDRDWLLDEVERLEAKVEEQRCLLERACDLGERAIAAAKEQADG